MTTIDLRLYAPAANRNRDPILEVLQEHLPDPARVLEIASGTGEHAVYFSDNIEKISLWQPTDIESSALKSIEAWREHYPETKVLRAKYVDFSSKNTHLEHDYNTLVAINLIHITSWNTAENLIKFASETLSTAGMFYLYGPFWQKNSEPAESNQHFDQSLKKQNPEWGIRDLEAITDTAERHGLSLKTVTPMPANNLSVIFLKNHR